jgi:VanZ family protein
VGVVLQSLLIISWGILLFVFTCASDSGFWISGTLPSFHWSASPDFNEMTNLDLKYSIGYLIRKAGHFSGFSILLVLFYSKCKNIGKSIVFSISYALLTELLQLYFGRDGRLYDVVIDSAGVLFGMIVMQMMYKLKRLYKLSNVN